MKDTATSRTPVEIWTYILKIAINPSMGCYDNDNIAQDLRLFQVECDSARAFIESEKYRTSLRLVCRSWNMALKNAGYKLTICLLREEEDTEFPPTISPIPAHRIEFSYIDDDFTHFFCSYEPCSIDRVIDRQEALRLQIKGNPRGGFDQLEALLLHGTPIQFENLPFQAPGLRLLSLSSDEMFNKPVHIPNTLQSLSHLYMNKLTVEAFEGFKQDISLPNLVILSIYVKWVTHIESEATSLVGIENRLPKLKRLDLRGCLLGDNWPYLKRFIIACRATITELVFRILVGHNANNQEYPSYWGVMRELMDKMPHLTLYGTDRLGFVVERPFMGIGKRLPTFLVIGIVKIMARKLAEAFKQVVDLLGIANLMVDERWYELRELLGKKARSSTHSDTLKTFASSLNCLMEQGVIIRDIDGTPLTGSSGRELLKWLEDPKL